ncbi:uncharacterized protein G2W53_015385 [Senna tora]|uniref:Uncharacterized protein n=1 Tax=Senna tora TaxID=362788 RepID=A0A834WVI5_9FABA|nr:uncharacterized protein G2W53_015385 [Senna tora]
MCADDATVVDGPALSSRLPDLATRAGETGAMIFKGTSVGGIATPACLHKELMSRTRSFVTSMRWEPSSSLQERKCNHDLAVTLRLDRSKLLYCPLESFFQGLEPSSAFILKLLLSSS